MRIFLFISFIVVCGNTFAKDKVYDKLAVLYKSDRDKCLELCKKYIAKNESNAIPYYFQSNIYVDKSNEARTLKGKYQQLYRSISSAIKFEKYATDTQREKVSWSELTQTIWSQSNKVIARLEKEGELELAQTLNKRLDLVPSFDYLMDQKVLLADNNLKEAVDFQQKNEFFGIPSGKEQIAAEIVVEQSVLTLINSYRTKQGLTPFQLNQNLAAAARYHAYDQATQGYFDHSTMDVQEGKLIPICGPFERIERFAPGEAQGEIIAAGKASAESTLNDWLQSKEHKAILDNPNAQSIGIGFAFNPNSPMTYYWVVVTGY